MTFFIIKRAENGTAFIFGVESPLFNLDLEAKNLTNLDFLLETDYEEVKEGRTNLERLIMSRQDFQWLVR